MSGPAVTIVESGGIAVTAVESGAPQMTLVDEGGIAVTVVESGGLPFVIEGYGVPPALSAPTDEADGSFGFTGTVETNRFGGALYWYVSLSDTPPSAADLKAGTGAVAFGSQAVTASGVQPVAGDGLDAEQSYFVHYLHNRSGFDSEIVTADGFTTPAEIGTIADLAATAQSDTEILLEWTPAANASEQQYRIDGGAPVTCDDNTGEQLVSGLSFAHGDYDFETRGKEGAHFGAWSNVATEATTAPGSVPTNLTPPDIIETTLAVGMSPTWTNGTWTGSPTSYTAELYADDVLIAGGPYESGEYELQLAEEGADIKVGVVATNGLGDSVEVFSDPVGPSLDEDFDPDMPVIPLALDTGMTTYPPVFEAGPVPAFYQAGVHSFELQHADNYPDLVADLGTSAVVAYGASEYAANEADFGLSSIETPAVTFGRLRGLNPGAGTYGAWSNYVVHGDDVAPAITSADDPDVDENATLSYSATATKLGYWTITGGANSALFEFSGAEPATSRTLRFLSNGTVNLEDDDIGATLEVEITVTALNGLTDTQTVTLTINDVDEVPATDTWADEDDADLDTEYQRDYVVAGIVVGETVEFRVTGTGVTIGVNGGAHAGQGPVSAELGDTINVYTQSSSSEAIGRLATLYGGEPEVEIASFTTTTASSYEAESVALFNRWSAAGAAASDPDKVIANALIVALKNGAVSGSNILAKHDLLYIPAVHSDLVDHINWAQDAYHGTESGAGKTWTAYEGIDNTSTYRMDSGFNPTTAVGAQSSQNSVCIWVYSRDNVTSSTEWDYGNASLQINCRHTTNTTLRALLNSSSFWNSGVTTPDSLGFHAASRTSSNTVRLFRNGSTLYTSSAVNSATPTNANLLLCGTTTGGSTREMGAAGLASGLTENELIDLNNAIEAYFDAHGKGVV